MAQIIRRTAIKRKPPKRRPGFDDPKYRAWLRQWPCYVCLVHHCRKHWLNFEKAIQSDECREIFRSMKSQWDCGFTEVAHVGIRGLGQQCKDRDAMPLGVAHHRQGNEAAHVLGKGFWSFHGIDREEALEMLRRIYKEETGNDV